MQLARTASGRSTLGQFHGTVPVELPTRIVGNFPEVAIGVGKVPAVTSPFGHLGLFDDTTAPSADLGEHFVDGDSTSNVVGERDSTEPPPSGAHGRIPRECRVTIQSQNHALQLKEGYWVPLGIIRLPTQDIAIECYGPMDAPHAERDERDSRLHRPGG
jgi:hypothetical protein